MTTKTNEKTNKAKQTLVENVSRLLDSDTYKRALAFRKKFHNYSFSNMLLIFFQCPDAQLIAGYRKWQSLGRQVRKGERSIAIFGPMIRKVKEAKDGDRDKTECIGFRSLSVFDVSQTEGDAIPTTPTPKPLTGDSEAIQRATAELTNFALSKGWAVSFEALAGPKGCWYPSEDRIAIESNESPAQQLKTLIHEIGHAMFQHGKPNDDTTARVAELEAESTAFLTCDALGIDTGSYSFRYLAGWAGDPDNVLEAANRAAKVADQIVEAIK